MANPNPVCCWVCGHLIVIDTDNPVADPEAHETGCPRANMASIIDLEEPTPPPPPQLERRNGTVGAGYYWHYSDPSHSINTGVRARIAGVRSIWCTVREDWPNGNPLWLAVAHVEVVGAPHEGVHHEHRLNEHRATEAEAMTAATEWLAMIAALPMCPLCQQRGGQLNEDGEHDACQVERAVLATLP